MKESERKEMVLIGIDGKDVKFKIGILNGRRFNQLMDMENESTDILSTISKMIEMVKTAPNVIKEFVNANPEQAKLLPMIEKVASGEISKKDFLQLANTGSQAETGKSLYLNAIKILRVMLITANEKDKKLLNGEPETTFWQEQEVGHIIETANSFRNRALAIMYDN